MKKTLLLACLLLCSLPLLAQNKVTTFLGIPVDGTKAEMIQKLKAKGFVKSAYSDRLEGEFNGMDVWVYVHTNRNKVWRIAVSDANACDEEQIKVRFNRLCNQFRNNERYVGPDQSLSEEEDIGYEILVNKKRYFATFLQLHSPEDIINDEENLKNRMVWFTILKIENDYRIVIYYENNYNEADGSDL